MKDVSASWMWVLSVVSAPSSETLQLFFLALLHLDTNSPTPWRKLCKAQQGDHPLRQHLPYLRRLTCSSYLQYYVSEGTFNGFFLSQHSHNCDVDTKLKDDIHRPLNTLGRAGKGMASIDICYAVAAYNSVSEEHHHSYIIEFSCRTAADDVMNRLQNHLATAETKQASLYDAQTNAIFTR